MGYSFQVIQPTEEDWQKIESSNDSTVFHCEKWNNYLVDIGYSPIIIKVSNGENGPQHLGYLVGQRLWRGVKIVSSPLEGIGTYTQGLVSSSEISLSERVAIYRQMAQWLFTNNIASFFQVDDWQLRVDNPEWEEELATSIPELVKMQLQHEVRPTLHLNLSRPLEDLWQGLQYKSCKYCINKAKKAGLSVQTITSRDEIKDFVSIHYDQLVEVCKRHGKKPKASQSSKRMLALCESLFPDRILMIQVIGNDEHGERQIMSSGIFALDKGESSYWTGSSYTRYQKYCPNELMVWEAIRILHERGAGDLNFCGMARYKLKFGTEYAYVPRLIFTKHAWLLRAKNLAKGLYYWTRKRFL